MAGVRLVYAYTPLSDGSVLGFVDQWVGA